MIRNVLIGLVLVVGLTAAALWAFRREVIVAIVHFAAQQEEVGLHQPIKWEIGPATATVPPARRPPNIVVILADDLGINDISFYGGGVAGGRVRTPNIDRIAREGIHFTEGYAGNATCAPSRAMLLTGRYPTRTGFAFTPAPPSNGRFMMLFAEEKPGVPSLVWHPEASAQLPPMHEQGLPGEEVTLAEMLREADYHTVHIGKWHLGTGPEFGPTAQGFDESLLQMSGLYLPEGDPGVVNARLDFDAIDRFLWAAMRYSAAFNDGPSFEPGGYLTDWWTDEAVEVIHENRHRPFFLYLAHWAPHSPLQATREDYEAVGDIEPHRARVYAAMIRALDRGVGRVLDALRDEGLEENTIVLFSTDNGGAGYIGLPEINAPYRGWKGSFFEGGIKGPFFLRWPARVAAGTVDARPAAHIDVVPTMLAAAGASLPGGVEIDGIDLLDPDARRENDALFWQSGYYQTVRQGPWKLQLDAKRERVWLYDLTTDPTERETLASAEPARVAELRALLEEHLEGARAPLYPSYLEGPRPIDKTGAEPFEPGDEYVYWPN